MSWTETCRGWPRCSRRRDAFAAVHGAAARILCDERGIARPFDLAADFVEGLIPADRLPAIGPWPANFGTEQPAVIDDVLFERRALGTQRAAIDWVVAIALDVDDLRRGVLRLVAQCMDDDAAAD